MKVDLHQRTHRSYRKRGYHNLFVITALQGSHDLTAESNMFIYAIPCGFNWMCAFCVSLAGVGATER